MVASLFDSSTPAPEPVAGASIDFTLGDKQCAPPPTPTDEPPATWCRPSPGRTSWWPSSLEPTRCLPRATPSASTPHGAGVAGALGHFTVYAARPTKRTAKPLPFGPLTLADDFGSFDYDLRGPKELGVAAMQDDEPAGDLAPIRLLADQAGEEERAERQACRRDRRRPVQPDGGDQEARPPRRPPPWASTRPSPHRRPTHTSSITSSATRRRRSACRRASRSMSSTSSRRAATT